MFVLHARTLLLHVAESVLVVAVGTTEPTSESINRLSRRNAGLELLESWLVELGGGEV